MNFLPTGRPKLFAALSAARSLQGFDEGLARMVASIRISGTFLPFQPVAVAYAALCRRCFIADKPGLGKTLESLATVELLKSYPCLVICKKSAVGHWNAQIRKWLPYERRDEFHVATWGELSSVALDDNGKPVIPAHLRGYEAVILDESHSAKGSKTKRTKAAREIAKGVPVILCLTGTPILNRPADLIEQLRIMNRINDLGGWVRFARRYCAGFQGRYGWDLSGASNLEELNKKLRETCLVGREKKGPDGVLNDLPDKRRETFHVELAGVPMAEYRAAEYDVIEWIRKEQGEGRSFAAMKAEALVRINVLRHLTALGKVEQVVEWAKDFIEDSGPEERLVIFVHHLDVLDLIASGIADKTDDRLPPEVATLAGDMPNTVREQQLEFFRGPARVLVASLLTGGESIELTQASTVVFVEFPWTPAALEQAEDRLHRIGQANPVIVYSFVATGTIDEWVLDLLRSKGETIAGAIGGEALDIAEPLMNRMLKMKEVKA